MWNPILFIKPMISSKHNLNIFGMKQINWLYVLQLCPACLWFTAVQDIEAYFPPFFYAVLKINRPDWKNVLNARLATSLIHNFSSCIAVPSSPSPRQVCALACVSHHDELLSAANTCMGVQKASAEDRRYKIKLILHFGWYITIAHHLSTCQSVKSGQVSHHRRGTCPAW